MKKILILLIIPALSFGITLQDAVNIALKKNLSLQEKKEDIKINKAKLKEDYQMWMPFFFASYSYSHFKDTPYTSIPAKFPLPAISFKQFNKDFSNFEFGIRYPLFLGFKRINKIKISNLDIQRSKYNYNEEKNQTIGKVKKAYVDVLLAKKTLEIYKAQKKAVEMHLKQAKEYYKEGLVSKVDVLQAKVKLYQVEKNIKKAEGNLKIAKSYLNNLLNIPLDKDYKIEDIKIIVPNNLNLRELQETAVKKRSILKSLSITEKQLEYLEKIYEGEFLPEIGVEGKYLYTDQYPYLDPKHNVVLSVAVSIKFQGIKPYYSKLKTGFQKNKIRIKIKQLKKAIELKVKSAYENLVVAKEKLQVSKSQLSYAKEYYSMVKEQYKNQLASMTDLLTAESYYTSAKSGYAISYYQLLKAYFDLQTAIGANK